MSWHDAFLILGSVIATTVVLQLLGAFGPDLLRTIRIDFMVSGDPFVATLRPWAAQWAAQSSGRSAPSSAPETGP